MKISMQYLPNFLCQLIDAVAYNNETAPFQPEWEGWKKQYLNYYQRESDVNLSDEDSMVVQNLPPLLEQLEGSVKRAFAGEPVIDDLVKDSIAFFEAHDAFFNERERLYFVQSAPVDRLLKALIARLQGRADHIAIHRREVDAAMAVKVLHDLFQTIRSELPEPLVKGTIDGFRRAGKAFDMLAEHPDEIPDEVVEDAIFELRSAGELLEHIPNLVRRFEEEVGSAVPIIGDDLSLLRDEHDDDLLTSLKEQTVPAFLEMWEARHDGWLLDPEVAAQLLDETNQMVGVFVEQLEAYPENSDEFWDTTDQLNGLFHQIKANAMDLEELQSSPYWPEVQLVLNLLRGAAPMYAAQTLSQGVKEGEAPEVMKQVGQLLESYLAEPDPLPLLEALKILKVDLDLNKTSRACASCNARIALDAKTCTECGTKVEEFSLSG